MHQLAWEPLLENISRHMASVDLELFSTWIFFFLSKFSKLQND